MQSVLRKPLPASAFTTRLDDSCNLERQKCIVRIFFWQIGTFMVTFILLARFRFEIQLFYVLYSMFLRFGTHYRMSGIQMVYTGKPVCSQISIENELLT